MTQTDNFQEIHSPKYVHGQEKTKLILEAIEKIIGKTNAEITLLKILSIASAKLPFPHLNIIHCAPSGHCKTLTSNIASQIMPKNWTIPLKSDFTIFALYEQTKTKEGTASVDGKCPMVNDATLWLSSQSERSKQRSVNGIAELMTEGQYKYADFNRSFIIKGQISVILNLTIDSYNRNLKNLLGNTFDERCLTVFNELSKEEFDIIDFSTANLCNRVLYTPTECVFGRKVDVTIPTEFEKKIQLEASEYLWKSVKGYPRTQATVRALLRANAFLNGRLEVCESDFFVVEMAKKFLVNPLQKDRPRIIQMLRNKQSVSDICKVLEKDYEKYNAYVYRVLNDAKAKGLLS